MPFDYVQYQQKVNTLSTEQLHKEWENYTRQIAGGATSTATSVLFSPITGGVSLIGLGLSAPRIHNARKKREIIEAGLQARGETHSTRKRDVVAPMALAGAISGLTLGLASPGAEMLGAEAGAKGLEYTVAHAALDGTGATLEQKHDDRTKSKGEAKLQQQKQRQRQRQQQQQQQQQQQHNFQTQQPVLDCGHATQMVGYQAMMQAPPNMVRLPGVAAPLGMIAMVAQTSPQPLQYQWQPQLLAQGQRQPYSPVPVSNPTAQPIVAAYGPASHQQQCVQQPHSPNMVISQTVLPYQQPQQPFQQYFQQSSQGKHVEGGPVVAGRHPPGKQEEVYTITPPERCPSSSCSERLPDHSCTSSSMAPLGSNNKMPLTQDYFDSTAQITVNELPVQASSTLGGASAESGKDEQITLLNARLLQMELEKPGLSLSAPGAPGHSHTPAPMSSQISLGLGCSDQQHASRASTPLPPPGPPHHALVQTCSPPSCAPPTSLNYTPSPMTTPPPQYNDNTQSNRNPTPSQQQFTMPPPPPGPPPSQYQSQPTKLEIQRNDSGYYSQPPSRTTSVSLTPYVPTPQLQYSVPVQSPQPQTPSSSIVSPVSPQSTGASMYDPSQHRGSIPSTLLYTPASTPGSAMCFPAPPGATNSPAVYPMGEQDYFPPQQGVSTLQRPIYQPQIQMQQPELPQITGTIYSQPPPKSPIQPQLTGQSYAQLTQQPILNPQAQGTQGWQWGTAQPQPLQQQQYNPWQPAQQVQTPAGYPVQQQANR